MVSSTSCEATKSGVPPTGKRGASSLTERTDIKVLVACEESQAVCIAFRRLGYEAYSCDIQECSGGHPEWHIKVDALLLLGRYLVFKTEDGKAHYVERWDLIIAHPPCTFMSNAGACRMYPRKGQIDKARFQKAMEAKAFFLRFLNADCDRVAIENPRPLKIVELPKEDQRIQPYQFGDPWSKLTYLWLKNLPPLVYTNVLTEWKPFVPAGTGRKAGGDSYGARIPHNSRARSKTFPGIANAMAQQWGAVLGGDTAEP